ncbi:MAG: beta-propeller fold lactonase family protein [Bryobacterales bacterium]|nr:beta-propeller fold lactonase family protein [Bryobacterales bacterium]
MDFRRLSLLALIAGSSYGFAAPQRMALYAANGPELSTYRADVDGMSLSKHSTVMLPQNVQEAWPHPSRRYLYVAWSNNRKGAPGRHGVTALRIDPSTGALQPHGQSITVAARSVFITVDKPGRFLIVAYNDPSGVTVHKIQPDGTLGAPVPQPAGLDFGIYAHQVRVDPTGNAVILPTRGNVATATKPEDPGAIKVYSYKDGILTNRLSVAPNGGRNFQPRHVDFHPTKPFVYATIEAQNKLQVYGILSGPTLTPTPLFTKETLRHPDHMQGQATSAIHVHPNGRFLYLGNRGLTMTNYNGKKVLADVENSIAVYSINQQSGEPTLIQSAATHGFHPRTFTLDPGGRMLVVANMQPASVREKDEVRSMPANLAVFRIATDGKLEFVRKYDQEAGKGGVFWTGMVELPR